VRRGIADIAEVPMQVVDEFSTRRHEIEAHMAENGFDSARSAQLAAYATRRMKDHTATPESLVDTWQAARASELGFDCEQVCDRLNADIDTLRWTGLVHLTPMFEHLAGPDGLTKTRSTFGRREVIQGICDRLPIGAPSPTSANGLICSSTPNTAHDSQAPSRRSSEPATAGPCRHEPTRDASPPQTCSPRNGD
jgi:hypothetical protein